MIQAALPWLAGLIFPLLISRSGSGSNTGGASCQQSSRPSILGWIAILLVVALIAGIGYGLYSLNESVKETCGDDSLVTCFSETVGGSIGDAAAGAGSSIGTGASALVGGLVATAALRNPVWRWVMHRGINSGWWGR